MTFEFIYEKYFDDIHRYCYYRTDGDEYSTDEATAETFFLLQKQWETVKEFHEDRLRAWLYGVAKNKIRDKVYIATKLPHYMIKTLDDIENNQERIEELRRLTSYYATKYYDEDREKPLSI